MNRAAEPADDRPHEARLDAIFWFWFSAWSGAALSGGALAAALAISSELPDSPAAILIVAVAMVFGSMCAAMISIQTLSLTCLISLLARCPESLSAAAAGGALAGLVAARVVAPTPTAILWAAVTGGGGAAIFAWRSSRRRRKGLGRRGGRFTLRQALLANVYLALVLGVYAAAIR
ncbi:hypothetical protein [Botrimarina sp.]|uniref:hypothetical protein n=1 Tax=Botrimarina sp. TaxID=2795802 RepID=UPI0032ECD72F